MPPCQFPWRFHKLAFLRGVPRYDSLMLIRTASLLSLVLLVVGCGPALRTYDVSVKNETAQPLTLALTKDGPPYEEAWASPDDIAAGRVKMSADARMGYATIPVGATRGVKDLPGKFDAGTHALLSVYRGADLTIRDMIATKPGPNRQDVLLKPGPNRYIVRDREGALTVESPAQ